MNYFSEQGVRGALKNPSARKSIHNHWGCPFAKINNMNQRSDNRLEESTGFKVNQDVDEIDSNAISKLAHPISPSSHQRKYNRSNSLEINNTSRTDDDSDLLSKSLPTILPSKLNCSDSSDNEQKLRDYRQSTNNSAHTIETPNRSNNSRSFSRYATPEPIDLPHVSYETSETSNQWNYVTKVAVTLVVVLATVSARFLNVTNMSNTAYDKLKFFTDVSGLGEEYNIDADSILQVQSGVSTIFDRRDTGSFIFVYNSNAVNFNQSAFNKFINGVSLFAAKYLRNESTPQSYITVDGSKLNMVEHSELIAKYRDELNKVGLMLVHQIEDIPSYLAMAFHFYCDEYNPLVKKSAIFFTLNMAKCPRLPENKSSHAAIEKCLAKKWSDVPLDSIAPLLTRVVNVVIDVTSAF